MRGYIYAVRPAGAAIAAVLALSSTLSGAQEVPASADPVVVPPPVTATAPGFAAPQPVVQQTPSVKERLAAAQAASEAETPAPSASATTRAPVEKRAEQRAAAPQRTAEVRQAVEAAAPPPAPRTVAPPQMRPVEPAPVNVTVPPQQARVAPVAQEGTDPALLWAVGGGMLFLAGLGGVALMRRRERPLEDRDDRDVEAVAMPPVAPPTTAVASAAPNPRHVASTSAPLLATAPAGTLEAMVAAQPSPENPFRTHSKRMARARFLLAQREQQLAASRTPAAPTPPPQTLHAEPQMQTVYRLGSSQGRSAGYKPQTR